MELVAHNKRYKNFYKSNSAIDMSRSKNTIEIVLFIECIQKFIINQKYKEYDKDYHDIDI